MNIKSLQVKVFCPICDGDGCYDCAQRGYLDEEVDFGYFIAQIVDQIDSTKIFENRLKQILTNEG